MRINNNLMAMNTHRQLGLNNTAGSKSIEKLSSGFRINRAGDDAAGLAISEKMRSQIRGLNMASKNSQDGISLIQTAEGALNESHAILQRMRELAVQSSNDTNVTIDRDEIQKEMNQLTSEINRIGNTTEFNTMKLLDGSRSDAATEKYMAAKAGTQTVGSAKGVTTESGAIALKGSKLSVTAGDIANSGVNFSNIASSVGTSTIEISKTTDGDLKVVINAAGTSGATFKAEDLVNVEWNASNEFTFNMHNASFTITKTAFDAATVDKKVTVDLFTASGVDATAPADISTLASFASNTVTPSTISTGITFTANVDKDARKVDVWQTSATTLKVVIKNAAGTALQTDTITLNSAFTTGQTIAYDNHGVQFTYGYKGTAFTTVKLTDFEIDLEEKSKSLGDQSLNFQVGANENQAMSFSVADMRASALGVSAANAGVSGFKSVKAVTNGTNSTAAEYALDVSSHTKAAASVTVINAAIEKVSAERSKMGAVQNRLEHTIKNLDTSAENLQAAESRIRDVDMAKEMMTLTKNNILQQAAQAMLAQANQAPQGVLQLLR